MLRTIAATTCAAALIAIAPPAGHADEIVEIHLRGHYFSEPATVRITVAVEPDAQNRALRVEADGEQYLRASKVTLAGDGDKRLHTVEFKNLPAGNYMLRAEVLTSDTVRGQATQELFVTSSGGR